MRITNLTFDESEVRHLLRLAAKSLSNDDQGLSRKETKELLETLSPPNLLRLALSLPLKHRGGRRERAGRPKPQPEGEGQ